jgi:glycosyltransferase involved in cell wall biosynthesis
MSSNRYPAIQGLGVVVIGRNEGERLIRCLVSLKGSGAAIVYVDSASTDASVQRAQELGATVCQLSLHVPFTAGRARNEGFARLLELHPAVRFVQFVDGDCEVASDWMRRACDHLLSNETAAIVCGRRKERYPERSVYNWLCDVEWDTPVGSVEACGGDFMVRAEVFSALGGFNAKLIAGEEPEMCYRLRKQGWEVHRIDGQMTDHDAAMTRFGQWARRSSRAGYAYAARAALHWRDRSAYCWRENGRILLWAFALPILVLMLSLLFSPWFALLALAYPLQFVRTAAQLSKAGLDAGARVYAFFVLLGKWPEFYGQTLFLTRWLSGREQRIIEYK